MKTEAIGFYKSLIYTFSLIFLWRLIDYIPVPYTDYAMSAGSFAATNNSISVLSLGLMPYLSAYVLIEVLSLFVPPLKFWRKEGSTGRAKLFRAALAVTVLLAVVQGYMIAEGLESMIGYDGKSFINNSGMGFRLQLVLTLTAGLFLSLLVADQISKKGIGHGISVLLLVSYTANICAILPESLETVFRNHFGGEHITVDDAYLFLLILLALFLIVAFIVIFEKSHMRIPVKFENGMEAYLPLKLTTAGIEPASGLQTLIIIPVLLFGRLLPVEWVSQILFPPGAYYYIFNFLGILFLYYLLTFLFYNPTKMLEFLQSRNCSVMLPSNKNSLGNIIKSLIVMAMVGTLYLSLFVFLPSISHLFWPVSLVGVSLIVMISIALDIAGEAAFRVKFGSLSAVTEFHSIPKAGLAKSLLDQHKIPCHLRGYYHRALLYFFGPYIEVALLVPKSKENEAVEVIDRYLGSHSVL
jgi:preprotein translocase subunit SecY